MRELKSKYKSSTKSFSAHFMNFLQANKKKSTHIVIHEKDSQQYRQKYMFILIMNAFPHYIDK